MSEEHERRRMIGREYIGTRLSDGTLRVTVDGGEDLPPRLDLVSHSPTGFDCGYLGSGPAQLALALLADFLPGDEDLAVELYQDFTRRRIASLPPDRWRLRAHEIAGDISALLEARADRIAADAGPGAELDHAIALMEAAAAIASEEHEHAAIADALEADERRRHVGQELDP